MYEKTYEEIKADILREITLTDKREGSFVNDMISPVSAELEKVYAQFDKMIGTMFIEDTAGEYLEKRASEYGLARKMGTKATGTVTFTGTANTVIPVSTLVQTAYGVRFLTDSAVTVGGGGTVNALITAEEIGEDYNVPAGDINQMTVTVAGITAVTNGADNSGGTNVETDAELKDRLLDYIQKPATSGNAYQYRQWAMSVAGVGDAKVFPLDDGAGTVTVVPVTNAKEAPNSTIINAVEDYIDTMRPIGATVTVTAPTETALNVEATITIDSSTTLDTVIAEFTDIFTAYVKSSVFKRYTIDYYRCLSMFYDISGVSSVSTFTLNNGTANITISAKGIPTVGTISITEAV